MVNQPTINNQPPQSAQAQSQPQQASPYASQPPQPPQPPQAPPRAPHHTKKIIIGVIVGIVVMIIMAIGGYVWYVLHSLNSARELSRIAAFKSMASSLESALTAECETIRTGTPEVVLPASARWETPPVCTNGSFEDAVVVMGKCKATISRTGVTTMIDGDCTSDSDLGTRVPDLATITAEAGTTTATTIKDSVLVDDAVTGSNQISPERNELPVGSASGTQMGYIEGREVFRELDDTERGIAGNLAAYENAMATADTPTAQQHLVWIIEKIQRAQEKVASFTPPEALVDDQMAQINILVQLENGYKKVLQGVKENNTALQNEGLQIVATAHRAIEVL